MHMCTLSFNYLKVYITLIKKKVYLWMLLYCFDFLGKYTRPYDSF